MAKKKVVKNQEQENQVDVLDTLDAHDESEQDEGTQQEPVAELTEEQLLLHEALEKGTLADLQGNELVTEKLSMLITVYTSLLGVLGADSPATVNALNNLKAYEPDKVKKAKKEKGEKIPKFNEGKEVRAIFSNEELDGEGKLAALKVLVADERISEELKVAITTYSTLLGIENIPIQALIMSQDALVLWGKKGKAKYIGARAPLQRSAPHEIEFKGVLYANLSGALRAAGFDNKVLDSADGTKSQSWNTAWSKVTSQFKKGDEAEYDDFIFTRHWLSAEAPEPTVE